MSMKIRVRDSALPTTTRMRCSIRSVMQSRFTTTENACSHSAPRLFQVLPAAPHPYCTSHPWCRQPDPYPCMRRRSRQTSMARSSTDCWQPEIMIWEGLWTALITTNTIRIRDRICIGQPALQQIAILKISQLVRCKVGTIKTCDILNSLDVINPLKLEIVDRRLWTALITTNTIRIRISSSYITTMLQTLEKRR